MLSLSARRAWIEIITRFKRERKGMVALRKESVDRNNFVRHSCNCISIVALRKESVDRNIYCDTDSVKYLGSLSARRAWIEMVQNHKAGRPPNGRSPQGERG